MASQLQIFGSIIAISILFRMFQRYRKLREIPGPFITSITDLWRFRVQYSGPVLPTLVELHRKYGSVVRIGPNSVSVSSPEYVRNIYTNRGEFKKADSYHPTKAFVNGKSVGSIIDMQDEEQNRALKRAVGGAFVAKNLGEYENDLDTILSLLIKRIRENSCFNLYDTLQFFQLDFLFKIAFSEVPGHLDRGGDVLGLAKSGCRRISHWYAWQAMPSLERWIFHSPVWGRWFARPSKWAEIGAQLLRARRETDTRVSKPTDLLQKCIDASQKNPEIVRPQTVTNLVNSIVSAGADTSAGTMTTILYFLLKNPTKYQRLIQELEHARKEDRLSSPPKYKEVIRLSYLDAVIKEGLRLNPPLAVPLERVVPEQGCEIGGFHLPPGTTVGCMGKLVHLDQSCYGSNSEEFIPERWLDKTKDELLAMERGLLSWGSGNRVCLGRNIADLELKKVIPTLLLTFNMKFDDPKVVMPFLEGIIEFDKNPIIVTFEKRASQVKI